LMLSLALSCHTPSSASMVCSSPCLACTSPPCWWQESKISWNQLSVGNAIKTRCIPLMNLPEGTANHQSGMTALDLHCSTLEFCPIPWPSLW
jgi:hypothetical protein